MFTQTSVVESMNHDFLPGEPESNRVWFITLRTSPPPTLRVGMFLRFFTPHAEANRVNNLYKVLDIHGRHVVVEYAGYPAHFQTEFGIYKPTGNVRMGRSLHPVRSGLHMDDVSYIEFPFHVENSFT